MTEILEVHRWADNSDLIKAVFDMHVTPKRYGGTADVMDVTYGKGLWWKWTYQDFGNFSTFTHHDYRQDGVDFRHLPEEPKSMDVITFDPDYIAPGGRQTSTIGDFNDRYGLKGTYESPATLQQTINAGLTECARVVRPQGLILVKCATYVSSGKPWLGEYHTLNHGLGLGLKVDDIFVHLSGTGPQPKRESNQQHARSNSSRLIVFRKPGHRKKT
jgi:hypothetical protein